MNLGWFKKALLLWIITLDFRKEKHSSVLKERADAPVLEGASQVALVVKKPPANAGDIRDMGVWSGEGERSPEEQNGNPLQCSCLENPMARGAWRATVQRVSESDTTEVT